jgi:hypothetical protein
MPLHRRAIGQRQRQVSQRIEHFPAPAKIVGHEPKNIGVWR